METIFDLYDLLARPLGWLFAVAAAVTIVGMSVALSSLPYDLLARMTYPGSRPARVAGWAIGIVLFVPVTYLLWRVARFAGGYIGSSEYPLHHVVRLIFG